MTDGSRGELKFKPSRIKAGIRNGAPGIRIGANAGTYMAAVLEYLVAEVLELAAQYAKAANKKRILPQHILQAVRADPELDELLQRVTIAAGGVAPMLTVLPPQQSKSKKEEVPFPDEDF